MRSKPMMGLLGVVLANVIWSGSFPATAIALTQVPPSLLTVVRLGTGALVLSPALWRERKQVTLHAILLSLILGCVGFSLPVYFETKGLGLSTPAIAAVMMALEPVFTAIVATLWLRETLTTRRKVALFVAMIGTWIIAGLPRPGDLGYLEGDLLLVAAVLCYALYNAFSKRLITRVSVLSATSLTLLGGFIGSIPLWIAKGAPIPHVIARPELLSVFYLALLATAGAYFLWLFALTMFSASKVSLFLYMQPILGVILSFLIVRAKPSPSFFIGAIFIFLALYMSERRVRSIVPPGT
ncbi:DMT family transporter [Sulfoacidibacillus ferrooxidans]|nr:DMT family transporter [Sulfoacidibacillus ferrooxidans]